MTGIAILDSGILRLYAATAGNSYFYMDNIDWMRSRVHRNVADT